MSGRSLLERRLIALGLLALALAVLGLGVIAPIARGFADRAVERTQLTDDLARGRRLVAQRPAWRAATLSQRADANRYAMIAPNASAAAEQSMDRIGAAIQAPGGRLKSLREQPPGPGEARVRVEAELSLTQLVASLKLLEGLTPYVVIENLSIAADPSAAAGQVPPLDVGIDLAIPYQVVPG
jgi:hypothetical protein